MIRFNFNEKIIKDENGNEIINFRESKALPIRLRYSIFNSNNERIGKIEKSRYNFGLVDLPKIDILINNDKITIQKDIKQFKDIYVIIGSEFSIIDDFTRHNFNIFKNKKIIASVSINKEDTINSYLVNIIDKSNQNQIISILFALSLII